MMMKNSEQQNPLFNCKNDHPLYQSSLQPQSATPGGHDYFEDLESDLRKIDEFYKEQQRNEHRNENVLFIKTLDRSNSQQVNEIKSLIQVDDSYIQEVQAPRHHMSSTNITAGGPPSGEVMPDEDLIKYIQEMIGMMTTEDPEVNESNKQLLVEEIAAKMEMQGLKPDKDEIGNFLEQVKSQQINETLTEDQKKVRIAKMYQAFYNLGVNSISATSTAITSSAAVSMGVADGAFHTFASGLSTTSFIVVAFMYTAQSGLNYRRYKQGYINKKEFWRRMKFNSVVTASSVVAGSGGAAAGFAIGTAIFPGVGSVIGAVVGGISAGIAGEKLSAKAYKTIEQKIEESKERKKEREMQEMSQIQQHSWECHITFDRFEEAMAILGVHNYEASLVDVELSYLAMMDIITQNKVKESNLDEERQQLYLDKYKMIMNAYEDIKEYMKYYEHA